MGRPKVALPFGLETMLARVVRLLGEAVDAVVVVRGVGQELPPLPPHVLVTEDQRADRGPLEGLAAGLRAIGDRAEVAVVAACDVPLLRPQFVRRMVELSAGYDVAVPHVDGFDQPLSAAYRTCVLPQIEALLSADRRRPVELYDQIRTRRVTDAQLADVDPQLRSLVNVNTPQQYRAALAEAVSAEGTGRVPPE